MLFHPVLVPRLLPVHPVILRKLALPLTWLLLVPAVLWMGRWPNPYLEHVRRIPPPHPYPTAGVSWVIGLAALEVVLLILVLRPHTYSRSWGRALIAMSIAIGFMIFGALGAMHAPPYYSVYLWWLILMAVGLVALFIGSASLALQRRLRS